MTTAAPQATTYPTEPTYRAPTRPSTHRTDTDDNESWARALGWFSIALGLAELAMPRRMAHVAGAPNLPLLTRACGVREIVDRGREHQARLVHPRLGLWWFVRALANEQAIEEHAVLLRRNTRDERGVAGPGDRGI